jgi:hypothetical protein
MTTTALEVGTPIMSVPSSCMMDHRTHFIGHPNFGTRPKETTGNRPGSVSAAAASTCQHLRQGDTFVYRAPQFLCLTQTHLVRQRFADHVILKARVGRLRYDTKLLHQVVASQCYAKASTRPLLANFDPCYRPASACFDR